MKEILDGFFKEVVGLYVVWSNYGLDGEYYRYSFDFIMKGRVGTDRVYVFIKDGVLYNKNFHYVELNNKWILYSRKKKLEMLEKL